MGAPIPGLRPVQKPVPRNVQRSLGVDSPWEKWIILGLFLLGALLTLGHVGHC
jgi:hypothetical protein